NRGDPLQQALEVRASRADVTACEIDQLAREPVADRPPEVLFDQPVRMVRQRLALVERPCNPGRERVAERRQRARLLEIRLRVADANLDGRKVEVRPHAPPDL